MKNFLLAFFLITSIFVQAQRKKDNSLAGEYYLRGVVDVVSGFKLNKDSTFQFYFSYDGLNRSASGKWKIEEDGIVSLTTRERPQYDFALVNTQKTETDSVTIKISDPNKALLSHVYCTINSTDVPYEFATNDAGEIKFAKQEIDSVYLIFEFCSERSTSYCIEPTDSENTYFEFKLEPWVGEVFFDNLILNIGAERLKGKHPLLNGEDYLYLPNQKY